MGTMLIIIAVVAVMLGAIVLVGFRMGVIRLERLETEEPPPDDFLEDYLEQPYQAPYEEAPSFQEPPGDEDDREDFYDYFAEEEELPEPQVQTEQTLVEKDLQEYDKLCGVKVGRGFLVDSQNMLNMAREERSPYGLCYFDFDRFRFINSLKGVSLGDYVLMRVAQALPEIFPEGSVFTRISGDHFAVLFPLVEEAAMEDYAEQLVYLTEQLKDDIGTKSGLRISIGMAFTEGGKGDITLLMERANAARCYNKHNKQEIFAVYDEPMAQSTVYWESALEDYGEVQLDEVVVYYQPVSDISKSRIIGFEALARWAYDDDNYKHISATPDNGRLPGNNIKIFYQVCRLMGRWKQLGKEVRQGFVYLSTPDFYKDDLVEFIRKCLSSFELNPKTVVVEISVSTIKLNWSGASRQLKKLQELGVQIAVNGVDRNYKTLDTLAGLPIGFAKLHGSFAYGIETDETRLTAVRAILKSAAELNIQTVFEGVDTPGQAELLRLAGARLLQGNFFGKAASPEEMMNILPEALVAKRLGSTTILDDEVFAQDNYIAF